MNTIENKGFNHTNSYINLSKLQENIKNILENKNVLFVDFGKLNGNIKVYARRLDNGKLVVVDEYNVTKKQKEIQDRFDKIMNTPIP